MFISFFLPPSLSQVCRHRWHKWTQTVKAPPCTLLLKRADCSDCWLRRADLYFPFVAVGALHLADKREGFLSRPGHTIHDYIHEQRCQRSTLRTPMLTISDENNYLSLVCEKKTVGKQNYQRSQMMQAFTNAIGEGGNSCSLGHEWSLGSLFPHCFFSGPKNRKFFFTLRRKVIKIKNPGINLNFTNLLWENVLFRAVFSPYNNTEEGYFAIQR